MFFTISLLFSQLAFATKVVIISDMNSSYGSTKYNPAVDQAIAEIIRINPDIVLATGDMVAGQKPGLNYLAMWDSFHKHVTTPLAKYNIPFAVTPGNHDGSGAFRFKLEREIYRAQWNEHKPLLNFVSSEHYPDYYAFTVDQVLFVSLDATLVGQLSQKQKIWLKKTLNTGDQYRHKIIFGHVPLYAFAEKKYHEVLKDPELENIFKTYKVSAYLSGHHHAYYPGKKDGIHYVSQACLGSGPRKLINDPIRSRRSFTIIDIQDEVTVEAIDIKSKAFINKETLPKSITSHGSTIYRDDLK